jgi:hypothetical protein
MKQPLTNDFGVPIKRQVARDALYKAGWRQDLTLWTTTWSLKLIEKHGGIVSAPLARAWEIHKQAAS